MKSWKRVEPTKVTKIGWRQITTKTFVLPNGKTDTFDVMWPDGQEFTAVIALTPENKVVIARQFRAGPEKIMDELPGGFIDPGEDKESATRRELLEETGYSAGATRYLGAHHKDALVNATWHVFLARDCEKTANIQNEDTEFTEYDEISISQLIENAKTDRMTDVSAVMMAFDELQQIDKEG